MNNAEHIKVERDQEERVASVVRRIDNYRSGDEEIRAAAKELVTERLPLPPYRDAYPGESAHHHADFVTSRLRLIWAMRQEATRQDVEPEYRRTLWGN